MCRGGISDPRSEQTNIDFRPTWTDGPMRELEMIHSRAHVCCCSHTTPRAGRLFFIRVCDTRETPVKLEFCPTAQN